MALERLEHCLQHCCPYGLHELWLSKGPVHVTMTVGKDVCFCWGCIHKEVVFPCCFWVSGAFLGCPKDILAVDFDLCV